MAKSMGVTFRALRFYDQRGLLSVQRDHMGRRCYNAAAQRRLHWIVAFRRVQMSLPKIAEVLGDEDFGAAPSEPGRAMAAAWLRRRREN